jgi:hypothetical protein
MKSELIDVVWEHGRIMPEADPAIWRQDQCGAWMRRADYGQHDSPFGWKIEKVAVGDSESLRPFHVRNHYDIADGRAHCEATADRTHVPAERYARPPRNRFN